MYVSALSQRTVVHKLFALLIKINTTVFFVVPDDCFVVVMALKTQFVIGIPLKSLTRRGNGVSRSLRSRRRSQTLAREALYSDSMSRNQTPPRMLRITIIHHYDRQHLLLMTLAMTCVRLFVWAPAALTLKRIICLLY